MTKRDLLLASLSLTCLSVFPIKARESIQQTELVIVGAGIAGLTAAVVAKEAGIRQVVILEKEPVIGGTSIVTNGFWSLSNTDYQRHFDIVDSDDAFYDDMRRIGGFVNEPELVRAMIRASREQYEWFLTQGIAPIGLVSAEGVRRVHVFDIVALIEKLRQLALQAGVKILTNACATALITENQRVIGVRYTKTGQEQSITATRGVLLATGGFSRNANLIHQYNPQLDKAAVVAPNGVDGDGLLMALTLGAQLRDTEYLKASFGFIRNPSSMADLSLVQYSGAIVVNRSGERFMNESLPYKEMADYALAQPGKETFYLFDEAIRQRAMKQPPDDRIMKLIDEGQGGDRIYRDVSLKELALRVGIPADHLQTTLTRYNTMVKSREQDWLGRAHLTSQSDQKLVPIEEPPFYLMPTTPAIIGTYCGVRIDERAHVLRTNGEWIPGLWAAGEITGGVHGASFIMGTAIAKAIAFGRLAALDIAGVAQGKTK